MRVYAEPDDQNRSKNDQLLIKHDQLRSKYDQARIDSEGLRKDLEHYKDTVKLKDEHISSLESTVHQALEKQPKALPPSEEEADKEQMAAKERLKILEPKLQQLS